MPVGFDVEEKTDFKRKSLQERRCAGARPHTQRPQASREKAGPQAMKSCHVVKNSHFSWDCWWARRSDSGGCRGEMRNVVSSRWLFCLFLSENEGTFGRWQGMCLGVGEGEKKSRVSCHVQRCSLKSCWPHSGDRNGTSCSRSPLPLTDMAEGPL